MSESEEVAWRILSRRTLALLASSALAASCGGGKEDARIPGRTPSTSVEINSPASGTASSMEICPDEKIYTGKYSNRRYGFSFIILAGIEAHWNSARCSKTVDGCICMGDHGRIIPLSDGSDIEAYAGFQAEPGQAVENYEKGRLDDLKKRVGVSQIALLSSKEASLGNLKARHFAVKFVENGERAVWDEIVALHKGIEYHTYLHTSERQYETHRAKFEKVISSWQFIPRDE